MDTQNEIHQLKELSQELAPAKTKCTPCKIILIATVVLFVCSVLLAVVQIEGKRAERAKGMEETPAVLTAEQSTKLINDMRAELAKRKGSSTIIIGKPETK